MKKWPVPPHGETELSQVVMGEASARPMIGGSRPTFWWNLHPDTGRTSPNPSGVNRPKFARRSIDESSADSHQISTAIRSVILRLSADNNYWFIVYSLQCMSPQYLWNWDMHFCCLGFVSVFWCWIFNWTFWIMNIFDLSIPKGSSSGHTQHICEVS